MRKRQGGKKGERRKRQRGWDRESTEKERQREKFK